MTKNESLSIKGVAILMMLFYHLFDRMEYVALCDCLLYVGDQPLAHTLYKVTNPVNFFLILSGYGLYVSHRKGKYSVWRKLRSLYVHYWLTLAVFVSLGSWMVGSDTYPGSWAALLGNVTAWDASYNGEIWFLFPYVMVMLSSGWIVKVLDRYSPWLCVGGASLVYLVCGVLLQGYCSQYIHSSLLLVSLQQYGIFLFPFTLGAYMAKYQLAAKLGQRICGGGKNALLGKWAPWALLLVLMAVKGGVGTGFPQPLYAFVFILLFANAPRWGWLDGFLREMGRRSTSMWFVHSWFCYYLFCDFIYGFRYPLVIFAVLVAVSYACAVVTDWVKARCGV